jgi:hypothetical protein
MPKKCALCGILLDAPCTNPACSGHRNERRGELCVYCATNERKNTLFLWERSRFFVSGLAEMGHGED